MHFPLKLYQLVQAGPSDVISWSDNGKSFVVVDAVLFCNKVLPRHFRHNKLTSFQRQLNLYGFQRIAKGTEAGRYYHPLFDKNRPDKLASIKREARSGLLSNGELESLSDEDADTVSSLASISEVASSSASSSSSKSTSSSVGTRTSTRSRRNQVVAQQKPVVAGPEDHTAALAMITISRSLSSESISSQGDMSPSELSSSSSNSDTPSSSDVKNRGEFESILKKSMERQSALEAEVGQLKSLVSCMISKMENMSSPTAHLTSQPSSMLSSVNSTSTCSIDSLVQSDNDLKRRRWESSDDNDDDGDDSNSDDGLTSKRIKENQPLPLTTPFVEETSSSSSSSSSSAIESVTVRGGEGLEQ